MTDHLDRIGGRTKELSEEERRILEEHGDKMIDMTGRKPVKFTFEVIEPEPCPGGCVDGLYTPDGTDHKLPCTVCYAAGPPPPSGYEYTRPSREGDPLKVIADMRKALGEVFGLLEQAEGTNDCCQGGMTERYCGMFGCTPDGCYGHEEPCPCDRGKAVMYLLEMADA